MYVLTQPHLSITTAIIGYVATHIDEIKEKQGIAVQKTMAKQADGA